MYRNYKIIKELTTMDVIYFSHIYEKMPREEDGSIVKQSQLIEVFIEDLNKMSKIFLDYDTKYLDKKGEIKYFNLSEGKYIILLLKHKDRLWTTIRKWTKEKEEYYRSKIGEIFTIKINEAGRNETLTDKLWSNCHL